MSLFILVAHPGTGGQFPLHGPDFSKADKFLFYSSGMTYEAHVGGWGPHNLHGDRTLQHVHRVWILCYADPAQTLTTAG